MIYQAISWLKTGELCYIYAYEILPKGLEDSLWLSLSNLDWKGARTILTYIVTAPASAFLFACAVLLDTLYDLYSPF